MPWLSSRWSCSNLGCAQKRHAIKHMLCHSTWIAYSHHAILQNQGRVCYLTYGHSIPCFGRLLLDQASCISNRFGPPIHLISMVLEVVNSCREIKEVNKDMLKTKSHHVKKKRVSKREASKFATPICRSVESLSSKNSKAKEQVWCFTKMLTPFCLTKTVDEWECIALRNQDTSVESSRHILF